MLDIAKIISGPSMSEHEAEIERLKAELAHAVDMGSQADVCLGIEKAARQKAEAACAEMRLVIWDIAHGRWNLNHQGTTVFEFCQKALEKYDCGTGWLSPEVREKVREAIEDSNGILENLKGDLREQAEVQIADNHKALALLEGEESK